MPWHHIIPKHEWKMRFGSLKGVNARDNLVELSLENHTQIHVRMGEDGSKWDYISGKRMSGQIGHEEATRLAGILANIGKTHTQETRMKMTEAHLGKKYSEVSKEKRRYRLGGVWEILLPNGEKEIIQSLIFFCKNNGLSNSAMCRVAAGKRNHHHGYKCRRIS